MEQIYIVTAQMIPTLIYVALYLRIRTQAEEDDDEQKSRCASRATLASFLISESSSYPFI